MEMTRNATDGCLELTITGRLDSYWADHLDEGLTEIIREGHHHLRLNLSGIAFMSSAGIAVLVKFHKRLTAIKGRLVVSSASRTVRMVLDMTRLSNLLMDEAPASAPEVIAGRVLVRGDMALEVFDLTAASRLVCKTYGDEGTLDAAGTASGVTLLCPDSRFAIGIGAFGSTDEECRDRYGEFISVAGAAAYLPGDGTEVPDYLVASDAQAPELRALRGITCDGPFAHQFRFDVKPPSAAVTLDDLAAAAIEIAGGPAGMVIVAEAAGLVGASLRRSPAAVAAGEFFAFPNVRTRLTFTAERAFGRMLTLVAGVAQPADGPVPAQHVRPLDDKGQRLGHFHAAAFPFHPFKKGRIDLKETVRALFDSGELLGLLHLLHDDREIVGVGQSEFTRGACWIGPIA
jgi:anti-anti-sigma factor